MFNEVPQDDFDRVWSLDKVEIEVLWLKCLGNSISEIGKRLFKSPQSISRYQAGAYKKLELDENLDPIEKNKEFKKRYCQIIKSIIRSPEDISTYEDRKKEYLERKKERLSKTAEIFEPPPVPVRREEPRPVVEGPRRETWTRRIITVVLASVGILVFICIVVLMATGTIGQNTQGTREASHRTALLGASQTVSVIRSRTPKPSPTTTLTPETPTLTFTPTPLPTDTPLPTLELPFFDDFSGNMNDLWITGRGGGMTITDGALHTSEEKTFIYLPVGLRNFTLEIGFTGGLPPVMYGGDYHVAVRLQDPTNYIALKQTTIDWAWYIVEHGSWNKVPGTEKYIIFYGDPKNEIVITVNDNEFVANYEFNQPGIIPYYSSTNFTYLDNEEFQSGGIGIEFIPRLHIDYVRINPLP